MLAYLFILLVNVTPKSWELVDLKFDRNFQKKSLKLELAAKEPITQPIHFELHRFRRFSWEDVKVIEGDWTSETSLSLNDLKQEVRLKGNEPWRPGELYYIILKSEEFNPPTLQTDRVRSPE